VRVSTATHRANDDILRLVRKGCVVFTVGVYILLVPFSCLIFAALYLIWRPTPLARLRRTQALVSLGYRTMHRWLNLVRLTRWDMSRPLEKVPEGAFVVIANHPTLMDVTAIMGLLGGACTVSKPGLHKRFVLRPILRGSGVIAGAGGDPSAAARVLDEAVALIEQGFPMLIFPEGTRSPRGELLPFGRAAFEMACRARVPVLSLAITCEPAWLSKEQPLFDPPHQTPHLQLVTLAIDDPARVDYDSRQLCRLIEGRYQQWFRGLQPEISAVEPEMHNR